MNYSSIANDISSKSDNVGVELNSVKSTNFDGIWSGPAHDTLTSNLSDAVTNASKQLEEVNKFAEVLIQVQEYKETNEKIVELQNSLSRYDSETDKDAIRRVRSNIQSYRNKASQLKSEISSKLSSFSKVSSQFEIIEYTVEKDYESYSNETGNYQANLKGLLTAFNNGSLTKLSDRSSLYDYFKKEDVEKYINSIKNNSSGGRDTAVNCALGIISLAASVGAKLDYDWGGGHGAYTTLDNVANGTDCSAFASWCINQGAGKGFQTKSTAGLINVGVAERYESAQKGDILVYNNGDKGHVMVIVENDADNGRFVVAEAANSRQGVKLSTRNYSEFAGKYTARDLSSIYAA